MTRIPLEKAEGTSIRSLMEQVLRGDNIMLEDEQGQRVGLVAYGRVKDEERDQAWEEIKGMQAKVGKAMKKHGVTEQDVVNLLLETD